MPPDFCQTHHALVPIGVNIICVVMRGARGRRCARKSISFCPPSAWPVAKACGSAPHRTDRHRQMRTGICGGDIRPETPRRIWLPDNAHPTPVDDDIGHRSPAGERLGARLEINCLRQTALRLKSVSCLALTVCHATGFPRARDRTNGSAAGRLRG